VTAKGSNQARLTAYSDASGNRCDFICEDDQDGDFRLSDLKHRDGWGSQLYWTAARIGPPTRHQPQYALLAPGPHCRC
jgi:hypothetical protein